MKCDQTAIKWQKGSSPAVLRHPPFISIPPLPLRVIFVSTSCPLRAWEPETLQAAARMRHNKHKNGRAASILAVLPMDLALLVLQPLSLQDKNALALTCRTGRLWVHTGGRSSFRVPVSSMGDMQAACDQPGSQARILRLVHNTAGAAGPRLLPLQARRISLPQVRVDSCRQSYFHILSASR